MATPTTTDRHRTFSDCSSDVFLKELRELKLKFSCRDYFVLEIPGCMAGNCMCDIIREVFLLFSEQSDHCFQIR
jgi:hypothetical protein